MSSSLSSSWPVSFWNLILFWRIYRFLTNYLVIFLEIKFYLWKCSWLVLNRNELNDSIVLVGISCQPNVLENCHCLLVCCYFPDCDLLVNVACVVWCGSGWEDLFFLFYYLTSPGCVIHFISRYCYCYFYYLTVEILLFYSEVGVGVNNYHGLWIVGLKDWQLSIGCWIYGHWASFLYKCFYLSY